MVKCVQKKIGITKSLFTKSVTGTMTNFLVIIIVIANSRQYGLVHFDEDDLSRGELVL